MTKPREKTREELQAEIEDGNKKRRSTQLRPGTPCSMNFAGNKKQSVHYRILRSYKDTLHGPSVEIRTRGLLNPIQARYQTSPHPDIQFCFTQPDKNTTSSANLQALF